MVACDIKPPPMCITKVEHNAAIIGGAADVSGQVINYSLTTLTQFWAMSTVTMSKLRDDHQSSLVKL